MTLQNSCSYTENSIFYFNYFLGGFMHDFLWLLIMAMHSGVNEGLSYQAALIHCAAAADVAGTVRTSTDDFRGSFSLLVSLIAAIFKKGKKIAVLFFS